MGSIRAGGALLAVRDLKSSLEFYQRVLGLEVAADHDTKVVLTGGLTLQTLDTWADALGMRGEDLSFGGHAGAAALVTKDFDTLLETLEKQGVALVRPSRERRWGQRVVRLYDPDRHIVEVEESLSVVARRFLDSGLDEAGVARRMGVPPEMVRAWLRERL